MHISNQFVDWLAGASVRYSKYIWPLASNSYQPDTAVHTHTHMDTQRAHRAGECERAVYFTNCRMQCLCLAHSFLVASAMALARPSARRALLRPRSILAKAQSTSIAFTEISLEPKHCRVTPGLYPLFRSNRSSYL